MFEFWLILVNFLGLVVFNERIKVDPQNVVVVKNCPRPMTPTEIQSFLVLAKYYRLFM